MAVNHILFNDTLPHGGQWREFTDIVYQLYTKGNKLLEEVAQMKDSGAVGQAVADRFGFGLPRGSNVGAAGDVTTAQAAVGELESLMAKINTTGGASTDHVLDAIKQFVAKFG